MTEPGEYSFNLLRLLLFTAGVAATCGVVRIAGDDQAIPVVMTGVAVSLLVLVAKRRDARRITALAVSIVSGIALVIGLIVAAYYVDWVRDMAFFFGLVILLAVVVSYALIGKDG